MKKCFKCSVEKPLVEFYKHSQTADGYLNKCKSCTKQDVHEHRHGKGREYVLAYDRIRAKNPKREAKNLIRSVEYRKQFAERKQAQSLLRSAVLKGDVMPMACWCCGNKAEAHHPDYSRPLDVVWLCSSHHKQAHALTKGL
jgi:hypothetical protein